MQNEIRSDCRKKRDELGINKIESLSAEIIKRILLSSYYKNAHRVFCYVAMPKEIQTKMLFDNAFADQKCVLVPVAVKKSREMHFIKIRNLDCLKKTSFGTLEPPLILDNELLPQKGDLMIVPGLAFDYQSNRIGYGGGYYDTYLSRFDVDKIAVCFDFQILKKIPAMEHDIKMDFIVSEKRIIERVEGQWKS